MKKNILLTTLGLSLILSACNVQTDTEVKKDLPVVKEETPVIKEEVPTVKEETPVVEKETPNTTDENINKEFILPNDIKINRLNIETMQKDYFGVITDKKAILFIMESFDSVKEIKDLEADIQPEFSLTLDGIEYGYATVEIDSSAIIFKDNVAFGVMDSELATSVWNTFIQNQQYH